MNIVRKFNIVKCSDDSLFLEHEQSRGIYTKEYCDTRYPVSTVTGFPMTDTGKLMRPDITPAEKEKIMNYLHRLDGRFMPSDLTDKQMLDLIPPRYLTDDAVDVQRWRDWLSTDIFPELNNLDNGNNGDNPDTSGNNDDSTNV